MINLATKTTGAIPVSQTPGGESTTADSKGKKKALTVRERFDLVRSEIMDKLLKNPATASLSAEIDNIIADVLKSTKAIPAAKGSLVNRGAFYCLFGTSPVIGTCLTPSQINDLSDGKYAITEKNISDWQKGKIPYGKGASALVSFHRRAKKEDGSMAEAFFRLDSYTPATKDEETNL